MARDERTWCFGVAVQSGVPAVGTRVPAALAGVGAVVVQAGSELTWRESLRGLLGSGAWGVVHGNADDPVIDLRVDGSRDQLGDLGRLLTVARAHRRLVRSAMAGVAEVEPKALRWARVSAERAAREGNPHAAALLDRVDQPPRVR